MIETWEWFTIKETSFENNGEKIRKNLDSRLEAIKRFERGLAQKLNMDYIF